MNEAAENGSSLWPMITFGIYWAYLIVRYEKRRRNGEKTIFDHVLSPHEPDATHERSSTWLSAFANRQNDPDEDSFLADAVKMYEFILANYATGKMEKLVGLLSPEVFEVFSNYIEDRQANGESLSLDIVKLEDARIVARDLGESLSEITVRFEADLLVSTQHNGCDHAVRDTQVQLKAIDIWTFQKRRNAANKTWVLVATEKD